MPISLTRSLVVILIPGAIAVSPWLYLVIYSIDSVKQLFLNDNGAFQIGFFALSAVTGSVFEIANSALEKYLDDRRSEKKNPATQEKYNVEEDWLNYLSLKIDPEPVGYRYLSRKANTLYFEMAMALGSLSLFSGLAVNSIVFFKNSAAQTSLYFLALLITGVTLCICFYMSAKNTHKLLCKTRFEMLQRIKRDRVEQSVSD